MITECGPVEPAGFQLVVFICQPYLWYGKMSSHSGKRNKNGPASPFCQIQSVPVIYGILG